LGGHAGIRSRWQTGSEAFACGGHPTVREVEPSLVSPVQQSHQPGSAQVGVIEQNGEWADVQLHQQDALQLNRVGAGQRYQKRQLPACRLCGLLRRQRSWQEGRVTVLRNMGVELREPWFWQWLGVRRAGVEQSPVQIVEAQALEGRVLGKHASEALIVGAKAVAQHQVTDDPHPVGALLQVLHGTTGQAEMLGGLGPQRRPARRLSVVPIRSPQECQRGDTERQQQRLRKRGGGQEPSNHGRALIAV